MRLNIGKTIHRICGRFHPAARVFVPVLKLKDVAADHRTMHDALEHQLDLFLTEQQKQDARYIRWLKRDMWYSFLAYHCPFDEYLLFRFDSLSRRGRTAFVTDYEREEICDRLNTPELFELFANKYNTYLRFREFYRREAIKLDGDTDIAEFRRYSDEHPRCIIKPLDDSCGRGVFIYDRSSDSRSPEELLAELRPNPYIAEEVIRQAEPMARLHPASVNTVRCATFMTDSGPEILFTFLRVGQGGSVVDNAGAGGLVASVDTESGIVETKARTEDGRSVLFHPDSGYQLLGMQIPRWDELRAFGLRLAELIPEQKYISWDFALTDDGWVIVEGNCAGQFVCPQLTTLQGIRSRLRPYFDV